MTPSHPPLEPTDAQVAPPADGAELLAAIDNQRFTGAITLSDPAAELFALDGVVYWVELDGGPSLDQLLVGSGVVTPDELAAGVLQLDEGTYVGRLTERVAHLDADAVQVVVEWAVEDRLAAIAARPLDSWTTAPLRKPRSGVHRLLGLGRYFNVRLATPAATPTSETAAPAVGVEPPVVAPPVAQAAPVLAPPPSSLDTAPVPPPPVAIIAPPPPALGVPPAPLALDTPAPPPPPLIVREAVEPSTVAAASADAPAVDASNPARPGSFEFDFDALLASLSVERDAIVPEPSEPAAREDASDDPLGLRLSILDELR